MRAGPKRLAMIVAAAACLAFLGWNWAGWRAHARVAAAWGARAGCGCRQIEGRDIASCAQDAKAGPSAWVRLADLPEDRAVRASVPLLAARTARYRPGFGCLLDP
jgi:hypothetical protein